MANCKSCGAEIVWGRTIHDMAIPLDIKSELRFIFRPAPSLRDDDRVVVTQTYQSHFATCPNAAEHRKPKDA